MTDVAALWIPILVSGVLVFVASSLIHMVLPWHKNDYPKMPDEDRVLDALRPLAIPPGAYFLPRPSNMKEMGSPEFMDKLKRGPVLMLQVRKNGPDAMGSRLGSWFLYSLVVSVLAAVVAGMTLPPAAPHQSVFHAIALTAFAGYSLALSQMSIWYDRPWMLTIKSSIDGLVYALITAETFALLWPR
jgi:hypothetical protein